MSSVFSQASESALFAGLSPQLYLIASTLIALPFQTAQIMPWPRVPRNIFIIYPLPDYQESRKTSGEPSQGLIHDNIRGQPVLFRFFLDFHSSYPRFQLNILRIATDRCCLCGKNQARPLFSLFFFSGAFLHLSDHVFQSFDPDYPRL